MASKGEEIELLKHVSLVKPNEDFCTLPLHRRKKSLMSMSFQKKQEQ